MEYALKNLKQNKHSNMNYFLDKITNNEQECKYLEAATTFSTTGIENDIWNLCNEKQPNETQKTAIKMSLEYFITIIQGPRGTGKNLTVTNIVRLLLKNFKVRLLLCAGSNAVVDVLTIRLDKLGVKIIRVFSKSFDTKESKVKLRYNKKQNTKFINDKMTEPQRTIFQSHL